MNKTLTEHIRIDKIVPGGQAIATLASGQKIFLWNALPGETVTATEIIKSRSSFLEGIATDFASTSPKRAAPRDACYLSTSPWQIFQYDYELEQKQAMLTEIFRQHQLPFEVLTATVQTDGHDYGYRNKMEYALYYSHEDNLIHPAFRARSSRRKVPVQTSSLERSEIFKQAQSILADLNRDHADARNYQSLLLRCSQDGQTSGGLLLNRQPHPHFPNLSDTILGKKYSYSPNGFFQINLPVYELALQEIKRWINSPSVLDLYAGVGTIGLSVASDSDLILVECDQSAYRELEQNCQGTSARPILAKSECALEYITHDQTVILDPPRAGCHAELLEKLLDTRPQRIIYLSCNPVTQARDVKILLDAYTILQVTPYNFFPRTPHLENLIILERKNAA